MFPSEGLIKGTAWWRTPVAVGSPASELTLSLSIKCQAGLLVLLVLLVVSLAEAFASAKPIAFKVSGPGPSATRSL